MTRPSPSLARHMAKGSAWTVGVRWAARALGLVNTLFLARLLTPKDFGIVTIAMIVVGTVEIFNQTGQHNAIIRHASPGRAHYDSAFTIFILLSSTLAAAVFLAAPLTQVYFHEPRAIPVVRILALKTLMSGFENIGVVDFRRDLKFHRQFLYQVLPSVLALVVTLAAAFWLRNYWALVIGIMAQQAATLALSYVLSPFRPHLSLSRVRELWSFSIWTFFRSIGAYLSVQIDKLAIGSFAGAAAMGRYEVAVDVGSSPSQEINGPMMSVLFPVMSKTLHDRTKLKELYLAVLYWSVLICSSTAIGVALVTGDMVDVVLGPQWPDVKPLMPGLALAYGLTGLVASVYPAFDVIGKPYVSARLQWLSVAVLVVLVVPAALHFRSLQAVVAARLACSALTAPVLFAMLAREFDLGPRDFFRVLWRPFAASLAMTGVVLLLERAMPGGALRLSVCVAAGALAYLGVIMAIWGMMGCPDGPEKTLWRLVRTLRGANASAAASGDGVLNSPEK